LLVHVGVRLLYVTLHRLVGPTPCLCIRRSRHQGETYPADFA